MTKAPLHPLGFFSMVGADFSNKRVLLRCDLNSPVKNGRIAEHMKILAHLKTLEKLKGAAVAVLSHQGRPGDDDFISLRQHAEALAKHIGRDVSFVSDLLGGKALDAIRRLQPGQVLVLENTRFEPEENIEAEPEKQRETRFVRTLAPLFDFYVNDAFATSHRSQPSLVGFPLALPSFAGLHFEAEVDALSRGIGDKRPRVYCLGGRKLKEVVCVAEAVLSGGYADKVLLSGAVGNLFLHLRGDADESIAEAIKEKGGELQALKERARALLQKYGGKMELPSDLAIDEGGRVEVALRDARLAEALPLDIGSDTIARYRAMLLSAGTIISKGPAGAFEVEGFEKGTRALLEAMQESKAYSIIGGGHLANVALKWGIKTGYVSTGGGASISFLSGRKAPAIEALKESARRFKDC
jgi:phosphoglycerate kinase